MTDLDVARAAARRGGELLLTLRNGPLGVQRKRDGSLVTDADLEAECEIRRFIQSASAGDLILGEETNGAGVASPACRRWIVDPLDGTTNYSRGLPFFAVSVALWAEERPVAAAVYLPILDEMFSAAAGAGATLNDGPIRVSEVECVRNAMINVYFDRHSRLEDGLEVFRRVALACEGRVKNFGSTASILCCVACGRLDGFVRNATKLFDFAAGALILAEAGGRVTDFEGRVLRETGQSLLASNGRIHEELARVVCDQP